MLSGSQFELISNLIQGSEREVTISTLANRLDWSAGHTSRVVSNLESKGCVQTRKEGGKRLIKLSNIEPVEQLEALVSEFSHVDFPELVSGSGFQLAYYLDQPRTATELSEISGVSRSTVYRHLNTLQRVGIVGKSKSRYRLNQPFSGLSSIARGLAHHEHRREAEDHTGGVSVLWETHDEYLFACDDEVSADGFYLTGPSLFANYNIPLLTRNRRHYIRSDRITKVSAPELICHTLIIDDSSRYRIYCLLLIKSVAVERTTLRRCAERYNFEANINLLTVVDELMDYLETKGEVTSTQLPTWTEFKSTAADYEINV